MNEILFNELFLFSEKKSYHIISNLRCLEYGLLKSFKISVNYEQGECLNILINNFFPSLKIKIKKNCAIIKSRNFVKKYNSIFLEKDDPFALNKKYEYAFYVKIFDIPFDFSHENVLCRVFKSDRKLVLKDYLEKLNKIPFMNFQVKIFKV